MSSSSKDACHGCQLPDVVRVHHEERTSSSRNLDGASRGPGRLAKAQAKTLWSRHPRDDDLKLTSSELGARRHRWPEFNPACRTPGVSTRLPDATTVTGPADTALHADVDAPLVGGGRISPSRFRPHRWTADVRPVDRLKPGPVPVEFGGDGCSGPFAVRPGPLVGGDGEHVGPLALV